MITHFKNVNWVVTYDELTNSHTYLRDLDIVFDESEFIFIGKQYEKRADLVVDGSEKLLLPGLIDLHSHPSTEPAQRGVREEHVVPSMDMSSLYQRSTVFRLDERGKRAAIQVAYGELLRSGVTTVADLSFPFEGWLEQVAKTGMRSYIAPGYSSARWQMRSENQLNFDWDEARGVREFERALSLIDEAKNHAEGRLDGMLYPAQIDTCTRELLQESIKVSAGHNLLLTIHIAQSVAEFQEMVLRHGITPIQWASDIGLLSDRTILGHAIFTDEHSWLSWDTSEDLTLLAKSQVHVAHCPTPFSRYGQTMEDFGRYKKAGVNLVMGTDCSPHNIIEEMRTALVLSRISACDGMSVSTSDMLHAATVNATRALRRNDLGKIALNCLADFIVVDLNHPDMQPVRDPLRSLIFHAADRAICAVYVSGEKVVEDGVCLRLDSEHAYYELALAQRRMLDASSSYDYLSRTDDVISPIALPIKSC